MGKRLSQLNQIERNNINQEDYLLIDGDGYLESKKTKLKDIDIDKFNTEKFYNKQQTDDIFVKKEEGKGLSTNDFTDEYKNKIENLNGSGSTIDIEIEKIEGGHKVSIIDDEEVESFNVMDGKSGVYVGSGDMPEGYNVQIDPDGEILPVEKKIVFTNGATITVEDKALYYADAEISNLTIVYPETDFICSFDFTIASEGDVTITLPESKYIGGTPSFANGETWEVNIKNGVVIGGLVEWAF